MGSLRDAHNSPGSTLNLDTMLYKQDTMKHFACVVDEITDKKLDTFLDHE